MIREPQTPEAATVFSRFANMLGHSSPAGSVALTLPSSAGSPFSPRGSAEPTLGLAKPTQTQIAGLFGPPIPSVVTQDQIAAVVWANPYDTPLSIINYANETAAMRFRFRLQYQEVPVVRAAVRSLADDICTSEITVMAQDEDDPQQVAAAKFFDWTIQEMDGGWRGVLDTIYLPSSVDGWSLSEPKLKLQRYKGQTYYGLEHVRSLDTRFLGLQLDIYRNVVAIVNFVRGLEYYAPETAILHTLNGMYSNPFGQSDLRAVTRSANIIGDLYLIWYLALDRYGMPLLKGHYGAATQKLALQQSLESLRQFGYIVMSKEDDVDVLNMAAGAAITGFEAMIDKMREDVYLGIRHTGGQNYMESGGGPESHTDTKTQQENSDSGTKARTMALASTIRKLAKRVYDQNFGWIPLPHIKFGGLDWQQTKTVAETLGVVMEKTGIDPDKNWAAKLLNVQLSSSPENSLQAALAKQEQAKAAAQQPPQPAAQPGMPQPGQPAQPTPAAVPQPSQFSDGPTPEQVRRSIERFQKGRGK